MPLGDDLSLLFRLRSQYDGKGTAEARTAAAQLKQSFGPELAKTVSLTDEAFAGIDDTLKNFVSQNVPIVGTHVVSLTNNLRGLTSELVKGGPQTARLAAQIDGLARSSGKTNAEITRFLTSFVRLEGQAAKNEAAFRFFGGSVDLIGNKTAKFLPEVEKAGAELGALAASSRGAGAAIAGMAGPIGIAVIAIGAMIGGVVIASKEIYDLTKRVADFEGQLFDLAQQTGLTVETLSALEVITRTTGGNLGIITQATVQFQRQLDDAQDPLSQAAERFQKFNIATTDTESALRSTFAALAAMPEGFAQTNAAAEFFGARGGKQVLAILKESNGDLDGAIKRLREMGILISTDTARAADKFNDELVLLEFQLRGLAAVAAEDLIPVMADIIHSIGEMVTALRPLISLLGSLTGTFLRPIAEGIKGLSLGLQILTQDWKGLAKAIKEAQDARDIKPLDVPSPSPVPLPGAPNPVQGASDAVNQAEAVSAAVKRAVADNAQALDQLFQTGRINRQQQTEAAIADIQKEAKAESDRIDALIKKREEEFKIARDMHGRESEAARAAAADINKLQIQQLEAQANAQRKIADLRFKALQEAAETERLVAQETANTVVKELDRGIAAVQDRISREDLAKTENLRLLEQFEQAKIEIQILALEQQKQIGRLTVEEQRKVNAQIRTLNQDLDILRDEQERRRTDRERQVNERTRTLIESTLDTHLAILRSRGDSLIATEQALADLRVRTQEEAARRILKINLDLIDAQIETLKTKFTAAETLPDENESLRLRVDINNQIKILIAQRAALEAQGNREIESARREDIENARRYADELESIRERIEGIERDTAEDVIRLMRLHFADRRAIIRAQRDLELQEEVVRHQRVTDSIRAQQAEVNEQIKTLETFIKELKPKTDEEIAEHDRLIQKLEQLRQARERLQQQQEAENRRSETRKRRVTKESEDEEKGIDPLEKIKTDSEELKEIFQSLEDSVVPLGEILRDTFLQVADAIGQTVANWVLLGETGPAVMRKILAQALASIAAEAAVNAIKELALGFATLFFNPAESAAHFTAAGLWAAIAGGSALAGRAVAGDLFKSKTGGIGGGNRQEEAGSGQLDPLRLNRAQPQPQTILVKVEVENDVRVKSNDSHIINVVKKNVRGAGEIREMNLEDGRLI